MSKSETLIVEIAIEPALLARFQGLIQAEDGLGVVRCFDPERKRQQIWTVPDQRDELYAWLKSLPSELVCSVTGERIRSF